MEIKFLHADMFTSRAQALVNPVNCQGVLGKGLALGFKERYPDIEPLYINACKDGRCSIGNVHRIRRSHGPWVINFATKNEWRYPSRLDYIEKGMANLVKRIRVWESDPEMRISSIAFPALGTGNGQLYWSEVKPIMMRYLEQLSDLEIQVEIYEPASVHIGVYPAGYRNPGHRKFIAEKMASSDRETNGEERLVLLVDLRRTARTAHFTGWNDYELKEQYGSRYICHGDTLGNVNYGGKGPIQLANAPVGIKKLMNALRRGYNLILLCGCPDYHKCHRCTVVHELLEAWKQHEQWYGLLHIFQPEDAPSHWSN